MRYFLELSYLGTEYCGWQQQPNAPTVQGVLEQAIGRLMRAPVSLVGAGRTDTGVHASYYVAHFDVPDPPENDEVSDDGEDAGKSVNSDGRVAGGARVAPFDLYHLNAMLPRDIAVHSVRMVAPDAHARFDAREREYKYYITLEKDPQRHATAWWYAGVLDVAAMNRAAAYLPGRQDFTTFSKLHGGNHTFICNVMRAEWGGGDAANGDRASDGEMRLAARSGGIAALRSSSELIFTIRADRFLRNMVRSVVGTLVDVGRGRLTPERFGEILKAQDRALSSTSAPAQGLFLSDILY